MHRPGNMLFMCWQLLFVSTNNLPYSMPCSICRNKQNMLSMPFTMQNLCRLNNEMPNMRFWILLFSCYELVSFRLWEWALWGVLESNMYCLYITMQDLYEHYKHLSELLDRNFIQQRMFNSMPSKDVQRHKHMPIMPRSMFIMRIINHMLIMHITIHFI